MIFVSSLQKDTMFLLDDMINKGMTHNDICGELIKNGYDFRKWCKNGYISKTETQLCKNGEYSFVDLIKRRNGLAYMQYTRLS